MAQKQNPREALKCVYKDCQELQDGDGEYCPDHYPKALNDIKAEAGTIKAQVIADADGEVSYIQDVAHNGCIGGSCRNLVYYKDTHAFYAKHADEIDDILEELEEQSGEPYDIMGNMKRLGQSDLRNFLVWLAYEVRAQEILEKLNLE